MPGGLSHDGCRRGSRGFNGSRRGRSSLGYGGFYRRSGSRRSRHHNGCPWRGNRFCGTRSSRGHRWPYHHGYRRGGRDGGASRACHADRRLGDYRIRRRSRGDRRLCGRDDYARFLTNLRHNLAGLRPGCCCRRWRCRYDCGRCRPGRRLRLRGRGGTAGHLAPASGGFLFLLFRENCLQRIARLGDVGQVNLGLYPLRRTRSQVRAGARTGPPLEMPAHFFSFVILNRAGVGLAFGQTELPQNIENLLALDFHLAREIVDSNLAHPPLFRICYPKP